MKNSILLVIAFSLTQCRSLAPITRSDVIIVPDPGYDSGSHKDITIGKEDVFSADLWREDIGDAVVQPEIFEEEGFVEDAPFDEGFEPGTPIPRQCAVTLSYKPSRPATSINVPAEWNNWNKDAHPMQGPDNNGYYEVTLTNNDVPPGEWGYKFLVDKTEWVFDPSNPLVKYVGSDKIENSRLIMPDCELPLLELVSAKADYSAKTIDIVVQVFTGISSQPLVAQKMKVFLKGNEVPYSFDKTKQQIIVHLEGLERGKYSFIFRVANTYGEAEPLFVPLWVEEKPFSFKDAILYFAMTDRFFDGDPTNNKPANCIERTSKANFLGGDFEGIRKKIEEGYFDKLGVNAIWISPPNDNPDGCYTGSLGRLYTAYHGYFPLELEKVEEHFGSMEDLKALVETAHRHGIRVLVDLPANHVHEESPIWAMHKDWFNQDPIICSDDDNWNQHPIDCWFQPYLPDLDFRNLDALNAFTDAAIFWAVEADIDGFRVDAVKHMIHDFSRTLRWKTKKRLETTGVDFILLGETFDGREKIKEYIGQNELQGQFDFPLYFTIVSAFARDETGLDTAISEYEASRSFFGNDAEMSNFLGNHDVPRFISHAAGQIPSSNPNDERVKKMAWDNPPPLPADTVPFSKLKMAFTFLLTLPGIPLIYYGDEVGLPGAGDPDNRRMMQFEGLSANQESLSQAIEILGKTRHAHSATRYGQLTKFVAEPSFLAYAVITADDVVIVILNKDSNATKSVNVSSVISGSQTLTDVFSGRTFQVSSGMLNISVAPFEALVLVKQSD